MVEKIDRKTDQKVYQPRLHAEQVRELYQVKLETGLPLTVLLNRAVREYLIAYETGKRAAGNH